MLCQFFRVPYAALICTIGAAILTPLKGEARQRGKNPRIFVMGAANGIRFASRHNKCACFTYKRRDQCSANNIYCGFYIMPILLALHHLYHFSLINWQYRPEMEIWKI
jgi:hypothetical protein